MAEIVLTGYTGFLGQNLKRVRDKKNLSTHLWDLRHESWREFVEGRSECFAECAIVHLASETNVVESWNHPGQTIGNNLRCLLEALEFCRNTGGRMVMASTAFLKDQKVAHFDEGESPNSPYHLSKAIGEELCRYFNKEYGVHCQNLRLFSIYGEGQPASSLVPTVMQQVIGGSKEIRIQSVDATRDFIYVDDVINAIESAIKINPPGFSSYQIGSGQGTSVTELIALIQSIAGTDKPVATVGGFHEKDRKCVVAQTGECSALGWRAKISLREGLEMLLPRFKSTIGA